jgi:hypothetical protein
MPEAARREKRMAMWAARYPSRGDVINGDEEECQSDQIKQELDSIVAACNLARTILLLLPKENVNRGGGSAEGGGGLQ